jgi:precorrin-6B methylase 2
MNPKIQEFTTMFQKSRILLSAFELDLFSNIEKEGTKSQQISQKLKLEEHACDRLMNALVSFGFLTKHDELFYNTTDSYIYLSKNSPDYMGGIMHINHLWNTWSNLTQVVKTGKSAHPDEINERGEEWLSSFITAMHNRAIKQAPQQLSKLDLSQIKSILDIGGGSGAYSMEFLRIKPQIEAAIFDLPNVIPITKKFIDKEGYSGKIKTFTGDYTSDKLPNGYDMIFLSAIIHSNSLETNRDLIKKCYDSLNLNGKIVIQDWIMNNDRTQPTLGAIFAINMLVGTEAGDCFTEKEVTEMLNNAGFTSISRIEFESGLSQMVAQKK